MAQEQDFSFISVQTDEEDDIVIQAGATGASTGVSGVARESTNTSAPTREGTNAPVSVHESTNAFASAHEEPALPADAAGALDAEDAGRVAESAVESAPDREQEAHDRHMQARQARRQANEMITTEEDLRTEMPFAKMQRVIMALFILLLVVFLAYWFWVR